MTENVAEFILVMMVLTSLVGYGAVARPRVWRQPSKPAGLEKRILQVLTGLTMAVVPILDACVPWFEFADIVFLDHVAWLGLALGSLAVWLLWLAQWDLERYRVLEPGKLVERGVYRYLRHPAYAAMLLWALAQLLLLQNWLAGPVAGVTFLLFYLLRVPLEEQRMLERYGFLYLDYMNRTGGLLPRWRRSDSNHS